MVYHIGTEEEKSWYYVIWIRTRYKADPDPESDSDLGRKN